MMHLNAHPNAMQWNALPAGTQMQAMPAFYDLEEGQIYLSRFADGSLAPMHVYDSLPDAILMRRELNVVSGYLYDGAFLTGLQTAQRLSDQRR